MGGLQRFEQRLENMVYGAFARVFRSAVQPVEIAAALERECDNNAQILSRQRRAVPNDFHVELAATDFDRLAPYDSTLVRDLTEQLMEHAQQQHYVFPGPVTIGFELKRLLPFAWKLNDVLPATIGPRSPNCTLRSCEGVSTSCCG